MDKETFEKACDSLNQLSEIVDNHFIENAGEVTPYVLVSLIDGVVQMIGNTQQDLLKQILGNALLIAATQVIDVKETITH